MSTDTRRGRPPHPDILTPAEWHIVDAVRHGMTNGQIARRRHISLDAVKFHVTNVRAKLGLSDRRALRFWEGAPVNSAVRLQQGATMSDLHLGPIGQVSRTVSDITKAVEWYRDVLGLPHLYTYGNLAFFDCGGTRLFLSTPEQGRPPTEESCLYFRVDDIQAAYQELMGRGVHFTDAPHMIFKHESGMEEWMAFFQDPDGRTLAIMSQPTPGA